MLQWRKLVDTLILIIAIVTHPGVLMSRCGMQELYWTSLRVCELNRKLPWRKRCFKIQNACGLSFTLRAMGCRREREMTSVPSDSTSPRVPVKAAESCSTNLRGKKSWNPQRASCQQNSVRKTGACRTDDETSCNVPHATNVSAGARLTENLTF